MSNGKSYMARPGSDPLDQLHALHIARHVDTNKPLSNMRGCNMKLVIEIGEQEIQGFSAAVAAAAMEILAPQLAAHLAAVSKAVSTGQARVQASPAAVSSTTASAGAEMIGLAEVKRLTGLSESSIWRHEKRLGTFPRRRQLSARRVAWPRSEVLAWVEGRLAA